VKVLLIYPNKVMVTRLPLGIGYLSSCLKKGGHKVRCFDTTFIKCSDTKGDDDLRASSLQVVNPDLKEHKVSEETLNVFAQLEREIESFKPNLIALSVADPNYLFGLQLLRVIKNKYKDILTIAGGPTPTFSPDEVISEDCLDMLCIGEGEEAMLELCNRIERGQGFRDIRNIWLKENGQIYKNELRPLIDINEVSAPDWDIFDDRHLIRPLGGKMYRMGTFIVTRLCLFRCKYCANFALNEIYKNKGTFYRIRRPQEAIEELKFFKEKYDLNFLMFVDDIFPLHKPEFVDEFCRLFKKEVNLPFSMNLHPQFITENPFKRLVDIGLRNVCVGLESGNPGIRKDILGRTYQDEQIIRVFSFAHKYGIRSSSFNMIGLPSEDRSNIFETIELNRKAKPTSATLTFFHPYRGTELRDVCIRENLFDREREKQEENVYRVESHLRLPQISKNELRGLFQAFQLYFKLPKIFYSLIRITEGESRIAKYVAGILKKIFYKFTAKEMVWDFSKDFPEGNQS